MARATTKADLVTAANGQFDKMWKLIDGMREEIQKANFADEMASAGKEIHWSRDKNLRDVLVHLYEWHKLLLDWIKANNDGESKPFLPEPYNWRTYSSMNIELWKKHQSTPLEEAMTKLKESHKDVMSLIEKFSNDELFAKGAFDWTGTSMLGSYCVSATASHYDWAMKKIKLHIKTYKE
ncbi:ClbS/DfsB family four-helix bundle protein [Prevotella sp. OH937_COT-195]|uniref:ClbS/DfsB family four-helix bundle protein n=1 Tax=Prevotella sp. OH937_COT-195 TaxID=2491051 RepID=UPI000F653EFA|nr:ClbS/DfsB family four-helix bundle protein [Prevotella sp. OH937_COT-195]RRD02384.1 DfsB family protein [Prevotella sp. OH937_COT-195]